MGLATREDSLSDVAMMLDALKKLGEIGKYRAEILGNDLHQNDGVVVKIMVWSKDLKRVAFVTMTFHSGTPKKFRRGWPDFYAMQADTILTILGEQ